MSLWAVFERKRSAIKWLVSLGLLAGLLAAVFFWRMPTLGSGAKEGIDYGKNYPYRSFKLPAEILRERIATEAARSVRLPILMYHYIESVADPKDTLRVKLSATPAVFERQMAALQKGGYQTFFARDIPDLINHLQNLSGRSVVITVDDGYDDFYTGAFPILKKYQTKATVYIMANYINRHGYLKDWQIKELIKSGLVEIGSHTLDHADLRSLRKDMAKKEIAESKLRLEKEFGIQIFSFAYPYGSFSKEAIALVKSAGYTSAVSVVPGVYQSTDNLFYLSRLRPGVLAFPDPAKSLEVYK